MQINNISSTNFNAKYIKSLNVRRINPKTAEYVKERVSLVEFDPTNEHDLITLDRTYKNWKKADFVSPIFQTAELMTSDTVERKRNKIYILTSQKDKFDRIHAKYILGLANMIKQPKGKDELAYFQVNPNYKYGSSNREFKNIGAAMINEFQRICKVIRLYSSTKATRFYERNGFKLTDESMLEYIWRKK